MRKLLFIAPLVCLTINTAQAARSATGDGAPGATLSCSADFKAKLQQQMVRVLKQKALSPAAAYLLPPGSEISEKNYTERVRLYTAKVSDRLSRAFDKFQETGDVEAVASSVLGNARKRTQVGVYSREENSKLGVCAMPFKCRVIQIPVLIWLSMCNSWMSSL